MNSKTTMKRYSLRWPAELHLMAEKAAAIKEHESLKSYLIDLVEKDARKTLESYSTIKLSNEEYDKFASYFEKVKDIEIPKGFMKDREDNGQA